MKWNGPLKTLISTLALATTVLSHAAPHYISVGNDMAKDLMKSNSHIKVIKEDHNHTLLEVKQSDKLEASLLAHEKFHRCGGFFSYETLEEAISEFDNHAHFQQSMLSFQDYTINQESTVAKAISMAKEENIRNVITKLSSYHNRYYKSETGVQASNWIFDKWKSLTSHRNDVNVELFNHSNWPQPSVILTIKGKSPEVVVIGGHADSIAGFWARHKAHAPGADDNASGIATMTETIRVLMEMNHRPEKTIAFMAYAAEEVGLLGSKEIAKKYKQNNVEIAGVLQLDMTNFKGQKWDIVLMQDYTNAEQNTFIGKLIDTYLTGLEWGYDKCGYGCSDHASWHLQGFPASIPFESRMSEKNHNIHTKNDTLESMGGNANHALKFSKLALSYAIELAK